LPVRSVPDEASTDFPARDRVAPCRLACIHRSGRRLSSSRPGGPLPVGLHSPERVPTSPARDRVAFCRLACIHRSGRRLSSSRPGGPLPVGLHPPKRTPTSQLETGWPFPGWPVPRASTDFPARDLGPSPVGPHPPKRALTFQLETSAPRRLARTHRSGHRPSRARPGWPLAGSARAPRSGHRPHQRETGWSPVGSVRTGGSTRVPKDRRRMPRNPNGSPQRCRGPDAHRSGHRGPSA
jgi:hypothetical protein